MLLSTYMGGSGNDEGTGLAIDGAGNVYVTGSTSSSSFPILGGSQVGNHGLEDAFLFKLSPAGTLLYSTVFGGLKSDVAYAVAVDGSGLAYIGGKTGSADLTTKNPFQAFASYPPLHTPSHGFVAGWDTTKTGADSQLYATYLGGSSDDEVRALTMDASETVSAAGNTSSSDFPMKNGFQTSATGKVGFYAQLDPSALGATQLLYSTFVGGSNCFFDRVKAIAADSDGNVYLTGSAGPDLMTTDGAFQIVFLQDPNYAQDPNFTGCAGSPFIAKVDPSLSGSASLVYGTYISGPGIGGVGSATGIAVDDSGNATITGQAGHGIPLVNTIRGSVNGIWVTLDGTNWFQLGAGTDLPILSLAIDSTVSPRTIFSGSGKGTISRSTDGGTNWTRVLDLHQNVSVLSLAVDPVFPASVYAGTELGVLKSEDHGATWIAWNLGLNTPVEVYDFVFDGGTLYAGTSDGLYSLNSGETTWIPRHVGVDVRQIAIDSATTPHLLYTASYIDGAYYSTDGGSTWEVLDIEGLRLGAIAVDTTTSPSTLYAYDFYDQQLWKTVDWGVNWSSNLALSGDDQKSDLTIHIDTTSTSSIIYVESESAGFPGSYKSLDGGDSWIAQGNPCVTMLDPSTSPAAVYCGSRRSFPDGYAVTLNAAGSGLLFSTYLGAYDPRAVALDTQKNIYVAGATYYLNEVVNAFQSVGSSDGLGNGGLIADAFLMKLGIQTLPGTTTDPVTTTMEVQSGQLTVTFPNITGSTTTSDPTLTTTSLTSEETANFSLSNNLGAFEISTTATFTASASDPITLCFQALTVNDAATFNNLTILHWVNSVAEDVTISRDFATHTICGEVTSLSPFIIVKGVTDQLSDLVRNTSSYNLQNGIQNSLDAKLQNALDALDSARKNDRTTACNVMGAFINAVEAQTGGALTESQAADFLQAANQIRSTLKCQ